MPEYVTMPSYIFPDHVCTLKSIPEERIPSKSMFDKLWIKWCLASEKDGRTMTMFPSLAMLKKERHRQINKHPFMIHPFSKFRQYWEMYMIFCLVAQTIILPYCLALYDQKFFMMFMTPIDISCVIDSILAVFTGYVVPRGVVLDIKVTRAVYFRSRFVPDLISSLTWLPQKLNFRLMLFFIVMKTFRNFQLLGYTSNILKAKVAGAKFSSTVVYMLTLVIYIQYNIVFQFALEYFINYQKDASNENCSWVKVGNIDKASRNTRYLFSLKRAAAMLRQNMNIDRMEKINCIYEEMFLMISWVVSTYFFYRAIFSILVVTACSEAAASKFYVMTREIIKCSERWSISKQLCDKIIDIYGIKFHYYFYVESDMTDCPVRRLREDMVLQAAQQLSRAVPFIQRVPRRVQVRVAEALQPYAFVPGDVILIVNTYGDCVYLIDKGSVAVYTETGREVCHLEDGDYFGEVALLSKKRRRTATVVAVTRCELFKLSEEVFQECFTSFPDVAEEVRRLATVRIHNTSAASEHRGAPRHHSH